MQPTDSPIGCTHLVELLINAGQERRLLRALAVCGRRRHFAALLLLPGVLAQDFEQLLCLFVR